MFTPSNTLAVPRKLSSPFGLYELKQAVQELLEEANRRPFQKREGSRRTLFEAIERPTLKPLPVESYEFAVWDHAKVNIVRERKKDFPLPFNQKDPPVTISRKHITIAGETFLISAKTFLIAGRPGSNEDESVDHFIKTITIAGNHKSISAKGNNTFAKRNNQKDLSGNRSCENILREAGNKLKTQTIFLSSAGNVLKEDSISVII